ncbi:MAG: ABC transporter permease subunit [Thermoleophilaceae bacterium]
MRTIAAYALRESLRRRVFLVVVVLTAVFLALYGLGVRVAFDQTGLLDDSVPLDDQAITGGTLLGLAMFATLFLGTVLAVFLTFGTVSGDAERGLLQTLVVRPVGRPSLLLARYLAAAAVAGGYALAVYLAAVGLTGAAGGWWPDRILAPGLLLAGGVAVVAALSLLASVYLSTTASGIAVFMAFGAGLTGGLLHQVGDALDVDSLENVGRIASLALPFEALYQWGLQLLTADTGGFTSVVINLGPFGGAQDGGPGLVAWSLGYVALAGALALLGFMRRDL